jgi:ABC-2 type transport system ATP-binding protein
MRAGRVVWDGAVARLRAEAPAPAHRLWTSDDARALALAGERLGLRAGADPDGGLVVHAENGSLDAYVLALGAAGIAVRRLELLVSSVESMFLALTGGDDPGAEPRGPSR